MLPKSPRIGLPIEYVIEETPTELFLVLTQEYHRCIGENLYVKCSAGTRSNYASIPAFCRHVFKPTDPIVAIASIVHDALVEEFTSIEGYSLYAINKDEYEVPLSIKPDWSFAADIFELIMIETAVRNKQNTFLTRRRIWATVAAVRAYGLIKKLRGEI